ncbi:MAG: hypothetical protein JWM92_39 [Candidatus Nomurabacteria bacterium]|jgi:hypothetical protein|nr:hypothetical protein [Candidatus Nomurabacteria bacterium]
MSHIRIIPELYSKYIKGTAEEAIVQNVQVLVCNLTVVVMKGINSGCNRVYINTRVLKHVYDKRPAEEFDFLIEYVHQVIKFPNQVYKNKTGKKGSYVFVKEIKNKKYLCSIEVKSVDESVHCEIVTFFRVRKEDYLNGYELLWEWKDGNPSS